MHNDLENKSTEFFHWSDEFATQVHFVDMEHKQLFTLINNLNNDLLQNKGDETLNQVIDELYAYTDYHFSNEEKHFKALEYPLREEHIKLHKAFLKQVLKFKRDFKAGSTSLSGDIVAFLKNWLIEHILVEDKKYADLFKSNGL